MTLQIVLRQTQTALDMYVRPEHRDDARAKLAEALGTLARQAAAGSDEQQVLAPGFRRRCGRR